jgi:hypothetical protein
MNAQFTAAYGCHHGTTGVFRHPAGGHSLDPSIRSGMTSCRVHSWGHDLIPTDLDSARRPPRLGASAVGSRNLRSDGPLGRTGACGKCIGIAGSSPEFGALDAPNSPGRAHFENLPLGVRLPRVWDNAEAKAHAQVRQKHPVDEVDRSRVEPQVDNPATGKVRIADDPSDHAATDLRDGYRRCRGERKGGRHNHDLPGILRGCGRSNRRTKS